MKKFRTFLVTLAFLGLSMSGALAQGGMMWKQSFGGNGSEGYKSVITTADGGFVVAGSASSESFGNGDWEGVNGNGKGSYAAIIVKHDNTGNIVWKNNFGGRGFDYFTSVAAVQDGFIAVGNSTALSFGSGATGDWQGYSGKGGDDAIVVKFRNDGTVEWKKNFGGSDYDIFSSVITVPGGFIAVGYSDWFNDGDWTNVVGKGSRDATIVKFRNDGSVEWKKNFGGSGKDWFNFITAVPDGFVAVGYAESVSFGTGDLDNLSGKGDIDAIIVKFRNDGSVEWKNNFGGSNEDHFFSVTAVSDGFVAVGDSRADSFNTGDWEATPGKGGADAIIVKFRNDGTVEWKNNFGGNSHDYFYSVTAVSDGVVAVGFSFQASFGTGDLDTISGKGHYDAIIVKFDNTLNRVWNRNFGGNNIDMFNSVITVSDGVVVAGNGFANNTGDWAELPNHNDSQDGVLVKYKMAISVLPTTYIISGGVTVNGSPLEGVNITCNNDSSAVTDVNGEYRIIVDSNATVILRPSLTGYIFTPEDIVLTNVANNFIHADFVATDTTITGISDLITDKITVYPNPNGNILYFSLETAYEITDIQGRTLLKSDKAVKSVSINSLPTGTYFVILSTERGKTVKKIIKE